MTMHDQPITMFAPGVLMNDYAYGSYDPVTMEYTLPGSLTASLVANPANGTLSLNSDGSFTYTPAAGFFGSDSFTYEASDGAETSNAATVSISVMNSAPYASDDSFMTLHDQSITAFAPGVLMNDYDTDGDPITPALVAGTSNGTLTFNSDGSFTYAPNTGYVGGDSFTYKVSDGLSDSNTATVTISVMNSTPYAGDDSFMTLHDQSITAFAPGVLMNDYDTDGDPITPAILTGTSNGTLTFNSDGSFTYVPNTGYVGSDSFTYKVSDGLANSNTATVTINIFNSAPVANDDHFDVEPIAPGESYSIFGVLMNDYDMDGDTLTISLVSGPSSAASFTLNSDGSFLYQPLVPWPGGDEFTYRISDGIATAIAKATIEEHCNCGTSSMPDDEAMDASSGSGSGAPAAPAPAAPAAATVSATAFNYSVTPSSANMTPWGFQFKWEVTFNAAALGKIVYQKIHTEVKLKDSAGAVLHWIVVDVVDLGVVGPTLKTTDRQDLSGLQLKIQDWVSKDRRVCQIEFSRKGDFRLVDGVDVNPVGPAGVVAYDPAVHGEGMADLSYQDSDGVVDSASKMHPVGGPSPLFGGPRLFDDFGQVGNAVYRMVWWDKVNSVVVRPWWLDITHPPIKVTMHGRLKFDTGIGGAGGAAGLDVFPEKSVLDSTVPGGIDRVYGPITIPL